jgi:hypothetical protein
VISNCAAGGDAPLKNRNVDSPQSAPAQPDPTERRAPEAGLGWQRPATPVAAPELDAREGQQCDERDPPDQEPPRAQRPQRSTDEAPDEQVREQHRNSLAI